MAANIQRENFQECEKNMLTSCSNKDGDVWYLIDTTTDCRVTTYTVRKRGDTIEHTVRWDWFREKGFDAAAKRIAAKIRAQKRKEEEAEEEEQIPKSTSSPPSITHPPNRQTSAGTNSLTNSAESPRSKRRKIASIAEPSTSSSQSVHNHIINDSDNNIGVVRIPDQVEWYVIIEGFHYQTGMATVLFHERVQIPIAEVDPKGEPVKTLTDADVAGIPTIDEVLNELNPRSRPRGRGNVYHACPFCPYYSIKPGVSQKIIHHAAGNPKKPGSKQCRIYTNIAEVFEIHSKELKPAKDWPIEEKKGGVVKFSDRAMLFQTHVIKVANDGGFGDHQTIKNMKLLMGMK